MVIAWGDVSFFENLNCVNMDCVIQLPALYCKVNVFMMFSIDRLIDLLYLPVYNASPCIIRNLIFDHYLQKKRIEK